MTPEERRAPELPVPPRVRGGASAGATAAARRLVGLTVLFAAAKAALLVVRVLDGGGAALATPWTPIALLAPDVPVLLAAGLVEALAWRFGRATRVVEGVLWLLFAGVVGYTAFNVPVARIFSTPLTRPIAGAAGGALWDSIAVYLTLRNLLPLGLVAGAGGIAAWLRTRRLSRRELAVAALVLVLLLGLGPLARARVDTFGLHRNALATIVITSLAARAGDDPATADPAPLAGEGEAVDLTRFAGVAAGRNVVWITLESTAAQYLALYSHPPDGAAAAPDATPNLTALARSGIVFDSVYCAYPESIKGLFAQLCATSPAPHTTAEQYTAARVPCSPIAGELARAGYHTALFHSGRFLYLGMQGIVDDRGFARLVDAGTVGGEFESSFGVDEASTVERMTHFIDRLPAGERFFLMYLPIAGHHPYHAPGRGPRPFPERREIDAYRNDLFVADAAMGQLFAALRARGLWDKTLFIVAGDHGEAFQQHPGNFAHTLFLYEENVHVPLVIAAPTESGTVLTFGVSSAAAAGIPAASSSRLGMRAPQVGSLIDLAPTVLQLLGRPAPTVWQGRSLLLPDPGVARFYTDHSLLQLGLRSGRWKFIHEVETGRSRLFDLVADPAETANLAERDPERVRRYRDHLAGLLARQRARLLAWPHRVGP